MSDNLLIPTPSFDPNSGSIFSYFESSEDVCSMGSQVLDVQAFFLFRLVFFNFCLHVFP